MVLSQRASQWCLCAAATGRHSVSSLFSPKWCPWSWCHPRLCKEERSKLYLAMLALSGGIVPRGCCSTRFLHFVK
ncbi:hypothetical protein SCLCIDRAFT_468943 [Scleroderma citrinum Foug A]|uniref:Uncharacterized protein n=1 Tax=Scleroderma citrinum Foug A TaxID=1036808 RepID=A0A0C3EAQ9_9AGAM|nr:hypothetical protein SCLCIDRAFT_468943 [Scleroderma citrinum Foug A]